MSKLKTNLIIFLLLISSVLILKYLLSINTTQEVAITEFKIEAIAVDVYEPKKLSQVSPEGTKLLTLKTKDASNNQISYSLYVKDTQTEISELVFSDTVAKNINFEVPFNTWSPDNQHFFIKQINGNKEKFIVFKSTGDPFGEEPYLDLTSKYIEDEIPHTMLDVTGWAAPYLLITQTTTTDGEEIIEAPSYWFDVSTSNFIQLSTRF